MPRNSIPAISPRLVGSDLGIDLLGVIPAISAVFACSRLPSSDSAGVDENGGGPGVRLRKSGKQKPVK